MVLTGKKEVLKPQAKSTTRTRISSMIATIITPFQRLREEEVLQTAAKATQAEFEAGEPRDAINSGLGW